MLDHKECIKMLGHVVEQIEKMQIVLKGDGKGDAADFLKTLDGVARCLNSVAASSFAPIRPVRWREGFFLVEKCGSAYFSPCEKEAS